MNKIFQTLGIKGNSQRVLDYLIAHDLSPVKDISFNLNLPKSTVYDALEELVKESLVTEYDEETGKVFGIVDKNRLARISNQKIEELKQAQSDLLKYINESQENKIVSMKPKIKFYFGNEGIRQAFRDTMWHSGCKKSYLMWPTKEMLETLGIEFSEWHSKQRLKHEVTLYVIRKNSDKNIKKETKEYDWIKPTGKENYRFVRTAPPNIDWQMSFWIYDNQCLFASSGTEKFAFIVHSKEFADLMKTLWNQVWDISNIEDGFL